MLLLLLPLAGCLDFGEDDPSAVSDGPEKEVPPLGNTTLPAVNETEPLVPYPHFPNDGISVKEDLLVESVGGHMVPVTVYRPAIANETQQVPVLLHTHGFTGSRWSSDNAAFAYIEAGFGVVSFDQRGHGDATETSEVNFMQPDMEVADARAVIDAIASWDWVLKDRDDPSDPRLGTIGYSYAGAMQLMTQIFDDRIDAMVPEMTWHNITTALAPNGVIKTGWVGLFYLAGNTISPINFSDDFDQGWAWAMGANELPAGQFGVVPDLVTELNEASPEYYPDGLTVPTRLIQGMPDTLFPLNQAVWNYDQLKGHGAPAQLYTHLGGHVLHTDNLYGESPIGYGVGLQGAPGGFPCGSVQDLSIEWHAYWLLELDVNIGREVCISLEDGRAIYGDTFPLPGTDFQTHAIAGPLPVVQAAGAGSLAPLLTLDFTDATIIAGIPRLSGSITAPGADTIVYFSFYKQDTSGLLEHIVDDQVRPLRIKGPNTAAVDFDIELGGIATEVAAGESLVLVVSSVEPMYVANSQRLPSGTVLQDLELTLPVVPNPRFS